MVQVLFAYAAVVLDVLWTIIMVSTIIMSAVSVAQNKRAPIVGFRVSFYIAAISVVLALLVGNFWNPLSSILNLGKAAFSFYFYRYYSKWPRRKRKQKIV